MPRWPQKETTAHVAEAQEPMKPEPKPIEKFYAKYAVFHFNYPVVGPDGKLAFQTNPLTGNPIYDVDGNPVRIMKMERFTTLRERMAQGFLSVAQFDPNTDDKQALARGEVLRKMAADPGIQVFTEDDHEKQENYERWVEKKRRIETEKELAELKGKASRVDELERRIAELEGKA